MTDFTSLFVIRTKTLGGAQNSFQVSKVSTFHVSPRSYIQSVSESVEFGIKK